MHRSIVPSRSRVWLRVAVPALLGIAAAGCSNSARFDSNPFASDRAAVQQDTTGSIATRPVSRVDAQPLPAPSRPATVAATGYATGAQGLGAYRPATPEYTGSVATHRAPAAPAGHWTWDGGSPVTVGRGETIETIARKYGVPASAIKETNGFRDGAVLRPGQRVVIPRYVTTGVAQAPAPQTAASPRVAESEHIVAPGESSDGHRAQAWRYARGFGARQQYPALCQDQHRRPLEDSGRPSRRRAPASDAVRRK